MANPEHLAKLKEGVEAWNQWRGENYAKPDLSEADLSGADLPAANLREADLRKANLSEARLRTADLREANLYAANLRKAYLWAANLWAANLWAANLWKANLGEAMLRIANLREVDLHEANLYGANLNKADLSGADLREANFSRADLSGARLRYAGLIGTVFEKADLTDCEVYGVSVWDIRLEGAIQSNLMITPPYQSAIQVDNLQVAQFIYLLLNNENIRHVIDTITSKVVLILGRFTPERKVVLDAIRDELRKRDYLPVLFDFQKPESKDLTGTVTTLANMARFIIADLTDPSSVPHELATIIPITVAPVQTILLEGQREYAMFADLKRRYHWVLEPYRYESQNALLQHLEDGVIRPAETKATELVRR
jgi:uncharacterized protein YjbI with pentapeptide repeats